MGSAPVNQQSCQRLLGRPVLVEQRFLFSKTADFSMAEARLQPGFKYIRVVSPIKVYAGRAQGVHAAGIASVSSWSTKAWYVA